LPAVINFYDGVISFLHHAESAPQPHSRATRTPQEKLPATEWLEAEQVLSAVHDELVDLAGLLKRIADNRIALVGLITIRHEVIGLLKIAAVDLGLVNETHHVDGVLGL
jgi:hypothetical protein